MRGIGKSPVVVLLALGLVVAGCTNVPPAPTPSPTSALPSATATATFTPTPTTPPTEPSTPTPAGPPTSTPTPTPTTPPTATPPPTPFATPKQPPATGGPIDLTLPPQNGRVTFQPGVTSDPDMVDMTIAGSIDATYLGNGCGGTVTAAPQIQVDVVGPSQSGLLRFYFDGSGDPTLLVRTADGAWLCNDDSYNGSDPTVDITDPTALQGNSQYLIWVGSYAGQSMLGTLYITAIDSNHP
jgi:hypothetical protein